MTPEQEEKFEAWWYGYTRKTGMEVWQACLEANGIGEDVGDDRRFRIGEAIEFLLDNQEGWKRGHVGIIRPGMAEPNFNDYRRIPAFVPKDGEAVLTLVKGRAEIGYVKGGFVLVRGTTIPIAQAEVVPLDVDNLGKDWSEI